MLVMKEITVSNTQLKGSNLSLSKQNTQATMDGRTEKTMESDVDDEFDEDARQRRRHQQMFKGLQVCCRPILHNYAPLKLYLCMKLTGTDYHFLRGTNTER